MNENRKERKGGLDKRIVWFFVFAILCVAAFFIVGLVRTCEADHEEKAEQELLQEEAAYIPQTEIQNLLS